LEIYNYEALRLVNEYDLTYIFPKVWQITTWPGKNAKGRESVMTKRRRFLSQAKCRRMLRQLQKIKDVKPMEMVPGIDSL